MTGEPAAPKPPLAFIAKVTVFVWLAASVIGAMFVVTNVWVVLAGIVNV